jgi:hypothetical protein
MQNSDRFEPNKILDDICCAEELCVMVCDGVCVCISHSLPLLDITYIYVNSSFFSVHVKVCCYQ